jgi:hypothetical protein
LPAQELRVRAQWRAQDSMRRCRVKKRHQSERYGFEDGSGLKIRCTSTT